MTIPAGHNGRVTDEEQTSSTPVPSPQFFARPAHASGSLPAAATGGQSAVEPITRPSADPAHVEQAARVDARFPATGDARVDQVIAHLPDPQVHCRPAAAAPDDTSDRQQPPDQALDQPIGGALPDPALLDEHITDVTSVHRQLQQRLSDLSG